jgi:hypothetical protein
MSKNRSNTSLIHKVGKEIYEVSKEKGTGKLFIKNTFTEVTGKVSHKYESKNNYDESKPSQAQKLGDEWGDYAWSADDY